MDGNYLKIKHKLINEKEREKVKERSNNPELKILYDDRKYKLLYSLIKKVYIKRSNIGEIIVKKLKEVNEKRVNYLIENNEKKVLKFSFDGINLKNFIRNETTNDPLLSELNKITCKYTKLPNDKIYEYNTILLFMNKEFSYNFKDLFLRIFENRDFTKISQELNCESYYNLFLIEIEELKEKRKNKNEIYQIFELNLNEFKLFFELESMLESNLDYKSFILLFSFYKISYYDIQLRKFHLESILHSNQFRKFNINEMLNYYERIPFDEKFNYIFNIFTSYFNDYL